jgi:hypothetical protein
MNQVDQSQSRDNGRPTFDDLLVCATNTYKNAYTSMSFIAAGGIDAFDAVHRQMRAGPLSGRDCERDNPFIGVLVAERFGLAAVVEDMAADLEPLLFDRGTGWPKVIARLDDHVSGFGNALCHCEEPLWAEAQLRAALVESREWLVADWTAYAIADATLFAGMYEAVEAVIGQLDTCPPPGASDSVVETTARLAGRTPSDARALDRYFVRTTAAVNETIEAVLSSGPSRDELKNLVRSNAELAALSVPLKFPLTKGERRYGAHRTISEGPAHPLSIDKLARHDRWNGVSTVGGA